MRIDVVTIFPQMINSIFREGVVYKGISRGILEINTVNIRDFAEDKHKTTDDYSYGGGPGMVMKIEPVVKAIESVRRENSYVILTTPRGKLWNQDLAKEYSQKEHLIIVCGRYKGIDERITDYIDDEISIGDYVLSGGELSAAVIIDSTVRLVEGVIGDIESAREDSFYNNRLSYPVYTRPPVFRGKSVPDILLSGNHKEIKKYRLKKALQLTIERRKDLIDKYPLTEEEKKILKNDKEV